jgi:hypothetical protein
MGTYANSERYYEEDYSNHNLAVVGGGRPQSTRNILINRIALNSADELYIELTNPYYFDVLQNKVYGVEIYLVATEGSTGDCDYRLYTGAIKNIGGVATLVGPGFTEIISAQDSNLFRAVITASSSPERLRVVIINQSPSKDIQVAARINTITLDLFS